MKRLAALLVIALAFAAAAAAQPAKKPVIMVVPSDAWCIRNGYYSEMDIEGMTEKVIDYRKALQSNQDIRVLISKMGDIMAREGYPMKSLEQELKRIEQDNAYVSLVSSKESGSTITETEFDILSRTARPDIILDLDFQKTRRGENTQVSFNLQAIDAWSRMIISGNTGVGSNSSAHITTLLEEAVLSFKDNFLRGLDDYFLDIEENGRIIEIVLRTFASSAVDFETEMEYNGQIAELADIIEVWFEDNCVEGRYDLTTRTANQLYFEQVRMPLTGTSLSGKQRAMDAGRFSNGLVQLLRDYGITCKKDVRGQGKVTLILGEK